MDESEGIPKRRRASPKDKQQNRRKHSRPSKGQGSSDDEEDPFPIGGRRSKRAKTGRIGRTVGKQYPPEIRKALGRANALYVQGNIVEASNELQQVVVQCSSIPEPYALLGLIYQDSGKLSEALVFYKLACTRDSKNMLNHQEAARIAGILGDHASRLDALKVLARLEPNNLNVAIDRARCLLELDKPKQALDVYAKAIKRFPGKFAIYLDLAEGVHCTSPQQHLFVNQALASCLGRIIGWRHLGPEIKDLARGFAKKLSEIRLERPRPKKPPQLDIGRPTRYLFDMAMRATDTLAGNLMEAHKRQEPQFETAIQVVESLINWLDYCREISTSGEIGRREEIQDEEEMYVGQHDSDSDRRDRPDGDSDGDDEAAESDELEESSDQDSEEDGESDSDEHQPETDFEVEPTLLARYGMCQLYCGEAERAKQALGFLNRRGHPSKEHGDLMLDVAKVYEETGHPAESIKLLKRVAQSGHPRRRFAGVQLGAGYAAQGSNRYAAEAFHAVLTERPHHAAALIGLSEAAYWEGENAVKSALKAMDPAIAKACTVDWLGEIPIPFMDGDDEGEFPSENQKIQLLLQWATLCRMDNRLADFASVVLPLVSVAIGQTCQRQALERASAKVASKQAVRRRGTAGVVEGATSGSNRSSVVQRDETTQEQACDADEPILQTSLQWRPSAVPLLLSKCEWQDDTMKTISRTALHILCRSDCLDLVGRRPTYWYCLELVHVLVRLRCTEDAACVCDAVLSETGFVRGVEREEIQAAADPLNADVPLRSLPGGSPVLGPATRDGQSLGLNRSGKQLADEMQDFVCPSLCDKYYSAPWNCVEEKEEGIILKKACRAWRPTAGSRSAVSGTRRSRLRALEELTDQGDGGDPICAIVRALAKAPGSNAMWNLLQRVAIERGVDSGDGGLHGEQVEAIVGRHREKPQGLLFRGHDAALWSRTKHALRFYSQACAASPDEPLPMLCMGTHVLRMITVMETMVSNDNECVLQALACLHRYGELRKAHADGAITKDKNDKRVLPEAVLQQEIWYNLGRGCHQAGLRDLAMEYYQRVLRLHDEHEDDLRNWHGREGITIEAAHNLCMIYRQSGAVGMALRCLHKYLTVG